MADFTADLEVFDTGTGKSVNQWLALLQPLVVSQLPEGHAFTGWGDDDLNHYLIHPKMFLSFLTSLTGELQPKNTVVIGPPPIFPVAPVTPVVPVSQTVNVPQTNTTNQTTTGGNQILPTFYPAEQKLNIGDGGTAVVGGVMGMSMHDLLVIGALGVGALYFLGKKGR